MAAKSGKSKQGTQRKLTAILCADVVGYSRLMGDDEEATIETLTAYRKVFTGKIQEYKGRFVNSAASRWGVIPMQEIATTGKSRATP